MSPLSTFGSHSSSAPNSASTSCRILASRMSLPLPVTPDSPKASSFSGSLAATDSWRLQSLPFLHVRTPLCLWLAFNADAVIDRLDIGDRPGCRDREVMAAAGGNHVAVQHLGLHLPPSVNRRRAARRPLIVRPPAGRGPHPPVVRPPPWPLSVPAAITLRSAAARRIGETPSRLPQSRTEIIW